MSYGLIWKPVSMWLQIESTLLKNRLEIYSINNVYMYKQKMNSLAFVKFFFIDPDEGYLTPCTPLSFCHVADVTGLFTWIFLRDTMGRVHVYPTYDDNVLMSSILVCWRQSRDDRQCRFNVNSQVKSILRFWDKKGVGEGRFILIFLSASVKKPCKEVFGEVNSSQTGIEEAYGS